MAKKILVRFKGLVLDNKTFGRKGSDKLGRDIVPLNKKSKWAMYLWGVGIRNKNDKHIQVQEEEEDEELEDYLRKLKLAESKDDSDSDDDM